jgi:hypothetical protein
MVAITLGPRLPASAGRQRRPTRGPTRAPIARRLAALLATAIVALVSPVGLALPVAAHGHEVLLKVTTAAPAAGSSTKVTAVATFADGDKAGGVALKATATGPGKPVTARLKATGARGTYTASLRLAPGRWKVTVSASGEHSGRGTATVTVPAPPTTTTVTTTTVAPATTAAAPTSLAAQPAAASTPSNGRGLLLAGVVVVLLALGGVLFVARRRGHPGTPA